MHTIAVIIPVLNEERSLGVLLARLQTMPEVTEIIVCDGGSDDATVAISRAVGVCVTHANGRGAQMNAGAAVAQSRVLWFLHADALPHPRAAFSILQALDNPRVSGGNFRLRFDRSTLPARFFASIARLLRRVGIYYGDSGIWLRREIFDELGGYRDWPLFEDYDLARRLEEYSRRQSQRTLRLWPPLTASSRRFEKQAGKTLCRWMALQLLFWLGVSPQRLARLYHR